MACHETRQNQESLEAAKEEAVTKRRRAVMGDREVVLGGPSIGLFLSAWRSRLMRFDDADLGLRVSGRWTILNSFFFGFLSRSLQECAVLSLSL